MDKDRGMIMKKALKFVGSITLLVVMLLTMVKLIKLIRKHSLLSILKGFGLLCYGGADLVEVSENGTKFLSKKSQEGIEAFDEYLDEMGYKFIGQFGSSNLYEFDGVEVVIKRTKIFRKFYLYEIFNERYFEEVEDYSLM